MLERFFATTDICFTIEEATEEQLKIIVDPNPIVPECLIKEAPELDLDQAIMDPAA
jgi:hypothetical protein